MIEHDLHVRTRIKKSLCRFLLPPSRINSRLSYRIESMFGSQGLKLA
jgi:hypothetical protein